MKDPAFLAEAAQALLEVAPVGGEELQQLIADIYQTPKDVVEKTRAIVMRGTESTRFRARLKGGIAALRVLWRYRATKTDWGVR